jgi:hypothetical protein
MATADTMRTRVNRKYKVLVRVPNMIPKRNGPKSNNVFVASGNIQTFRIVTTSHPKQHAHKVHNKNSITRKARRDK